jgi:glycosyltransferase involved in cell wall biosynthesis
MRVSVILTVYNLENYIEETLQSLLSQSYDDVELIIVDDASNDHSLVMIEAHTKAFHHKGYMVKIITNPTNGGVMYATCMGLKEVTGEIVLFLDGDDRWHPQKIALMVEKFCEDTYILLSHNYNYIDEESKLLCIEDTTQTPLVALDKKGDVIAISALMKEGIGKPQGLVWLGSAYGINLRYFCLSDFLQFMEKNASNMRELYQDWPLATYVLAVSQERKFGYISSKLLDYRIHQDNYSGATKVTRKKAYAQAKKGYETSLFIEKIYHFFVGNLRDSYEESMVYRQNMRRYYMFLLLLYRFSFKEAKAFYIYLSTHDWSKKRCYKEGIRFLGVFLFRDGFFLLKNIWKKRKKRCVE